MEVADSQNPFEDIIALVLAGGVGSRLREAVPDIPKVLAPVAGRPFIFHLLDQLVTAGVKLAVLCTGYGAGVVERAVGSGYGDMRVCYSVEDSPLGTGGGLRLAAGRFLSDLYLAMNGDSFVAADLARFLRWHRDSGLAASLLLTEVEDAGRFGTVRIGGKGKITEFSEKEGLSKPGLINAGVYLLSRQCLMSIPPGTAVSLERELFPSMVMTGVGGHVTGARFIDIGTPESFKRAQLFFSEKGE